MPRRGAVALAAAALCAASCTNTAVSPPTPQTPSSKIAHVVIAVQENRSFNDLFAGFPGAESAMSGPCKAGPRWCRVAHDVTLRAIPLAQGSPRFGGRDICHTHDCFEIECDPDAANVCRNDGFNLIAFGENNNGPPAKLYPYAYVRHSDVTTYWTLARRYALADRMFFTETAASFVAHQILLSGSVRLNGRESLTDEPNVMPWGCDARPKHGAVTPVIFRNGRVKENGPFPCFDYATIADLLDARGVSWRYYVDPFAGPHYDFSGAVWNGFDAIRKVRYGPDWSANVSMPNTNFFADVKGGRLPAVSWVIPSFANSDHPASGCNGGPRWIAKLVDAVGASAYWKTTAIVLIWDDWGGWYDSVPPPQINYTRLGFRVPMVVISPYARPQYVSHTPYNFGSLLQFVESTFGLGSLNTTDRGANSMEDLFDLTEAPNAFQILPLPHANRCASRSARLEEIAD
ncbi:MAG TPA: alkaline phosphatase family protein [Candidatus Cybelea sp.]